MRICSGMLSASGGSGGWEASGSTQSPMGPAVAPGEVAGSGLAGTGDCATLAMGSASRASASPMPSTAGRAAVDDGIAERRVADISILRSKRGSLGGDATASAARRYRTG